MLQIFGIRTRYIVFSFHATLFFPSNQCRHHIRGHSLKGKYKMAWNETFQCRKKIIAFMIFSRSMNASGILRYLVWYLITSSTKKSFRIFMSWSKNWHFLLSFILDNCLYIDRKILCKNLKQLNFRAPITLLMIL